MNQFYFWKEISDFLHIFGYTDNYRITNGKCPQNHKKLWISSSRTCLNMGNKIIKQISKTTKKKAAKESDMAA